MKTLAGNRNWTVAPLLAVLALATPMNAHARESVALGDADFTAGDFIDRHGRPPEERLSAGIAAVTARVVRAQARELAQRVRGPVVEAARILAADADRIGQELVARLDASKLRRLAWLLENAGDELDARLARALSRMTEVLTRRATDVLAVFAERAVAHLTAHHPEFAEALARRVDRYVPVVAARIAATVRAEIEDEYGLPRPLPEPEGRASEYAHP